VLDQLVDEDCGVVNSTVRGAIEELARREPGKLVFVDSRRFLGRFAAGVLKGNRSEVQLASGEKDAARGLARLSGKTGRAAFCTAGKNGIIVAMPSGEPQFVQGYPVRGPIDIVGAGDAATSGIVSGLLSGGNELEAAAFGNLVASITIQQLGTTGTATPAQVRERWQEISAH